MERDWKDSFTYAHAGMEGAASDTDDVHIRAIVIQSQRRPFPCIGSSSAFLASWYMCYDLAAGG